MFGTQRRVQWSSCWKTHRVYQPRGEPRCHRVSTQTVKPLETMKRVRANRTHVWEFLERVSVCVGGKSETNFGSSGALWMSAMPCCSKGVSWIEQRCRATLSPRSRQTFHRRSHAHTRTIAPFRRSRQEVGSESDGYGALEEFEKKGRGGQIQ